MPAPTFSLPTTGTDPKIATKSDLETAVQTSVDALFAKSLEGMIITSADPVIIDRVNSVIRFPDCKVFKNGSVHVITAADYALSAFETGITSSSGATHIWFDLDLVGVSNPLVTDFGDTDLPDAEANIAYLGQKRSSEFFGAPNGLRVVESEDRVQRLREFFSRDPIIIDRFGQYGAGAKVLMPRTLAIQGRGVAVGATTTVTNTESVNLAGYCELALSDPSPAIRTIRYDDEANEFVGGFAENRSPEGKYLPILHVWLDGYAAPYGWNVLYAEDIADADLIEDRRLRFFDDAQKLLMTKDLFVDADWPTSLFLTGGLQAREPGYNIRSTLDLSPAPSTDWKPYAMQGRDHLALDGSRMTDGQTGRLIMRNDVSADRDQAQALPFAIHKTGNSSAYSAVDVLIISDSILNVCRSSSMLHAMLTAAGITPNFIGTQESQVTGGTLTNDECVGGRAFADWIYRDTIRTPVSDFDAFLALSLAGREAFNPFVRPSTGGDPAGNIENGHIFDIDHYLSGIAGATTPPANWTATPTHIIIEAVENDGSAADVLDGVRIMHEQIRSALPNCHIGFVMPPVAEDVGGDTRWSNRAVNVYPDIIEYVETERATDARVWALPAYLYAQGNAGWSEANVSTDAEGVETNTYDDSVHPVIEGVAARQINHLLYCWLASTHV